MPISEPEYRSILIIRLSAIGDIVNATQVLDPLRRKYPNSRLAWLVEDRYGDILREHPMLDAVLTLPRTEWSAFARMGKILQLAQSVRAFHKNLRSAHFDCVLDLQGLLKSSIWTALSGAPNRLILEPREASAVLATRVIRRGTQDGGYAHEYRSLLRELGIAADHAKPNLAVSASQSSAARLLLNRSGVGRTYGIICPFTTLPQKHWPLGHWQELCRTLERRNLTSLVMIGKPQDTRASAALIDAAPHLIDLTGKTSIQECLAMIKDSQFFVGVDTGLTRAAAALNIPTIALHGPIRAQDDPQLPLLRVLYQPLECSPCGRKPTCSGAYTCMKLHSAEAVAGEIERLLKQAA